MAKADKNADFDFEDDALERRRREVPTAARVMFVLPPSGGGYLYVEAADGQRLLPFGAAADNHLIAVTKTYVALRTIMPAELLADIDCDMDRRAAEEADDAAPSSVH